MVMRLGGGDATMTTVGWVERPGEMIRVVGTNVTEDELLAVAEGLHPATEQEWSDLVEQSELGGFGMGFRSGKELGRTTGTFDGGTKWSLAVLQSEPDPGADGGSDETYVYTDLRVVFWRRHVSGREFGFVERRRQPGLPVGGDLRRLRTALFIGDHPR